MSDRNQRRSAHRQSVTMAMCGMAAGLSVAVMLLGAVIPVATYAAPLLCGLLLLPVMTEFGRREAWITFAVTSLVALTLGADKEAAFFYLFLGWYPLVKWHLDRIHARPLRVLVKLLIFTLALTTMYALLALVLHLDAITQDLGAMGVLGLVLFLAVFDVCMLMYDRLLLPLMMLYATRIRPKLRFLRR